MPSTKKNRVRKRLPEEGGGAYFLSPSSSLTFINSGATVLDCVLGGGWPRGRVSNIVGDKSTGKTLLAIEAMANFARSSPKRERCRYVEAEAAFDTGYAEALGLPLDRVEIPDEHIETVEAFYDDIQTTLSRNKKCGLYILDSLDALSDAAEMDREIGENTYGANKARQMSQTFRRIVRKVEDSQCHLMIVSQTRDRIGRGFGRTYTRTGGRALDFYASQIIYLSHLGEIKRKIKGVQRTIGVDIRMKCTKNKVGLPFRICEFPIVFGYGIEDIAANIDWLITNKQIDLTDLTLKELKEVRLAAVHGELEEPDELREELSRKVRIGWARVEKSFLPKKGKYTDG